MAAKREQKKGLQSGEKESLADMLRKGSVITRVGSFLKRHKKTRFIVKVPKGKPIGNVIYTVESAYEPVHFNKRKDAKQYQELLARSTAELKADIVRREVTKDGYDVTYGDK